MQCPKVPNRVNNECQIIRNFTSQAGRFGCPARASRQVDTDPRHGPPARRKPRHHTPRRPQDDAGSAIPLRCAATTGPEHGGHHPQPVPRRVLDQDGHHVPGRVGVEMPVGVPHHPGHQGGVEDTELARETMRDTINRDALGIGGHHHRQRARPRRRRSITQPVHSHTHQPQARPHSDNHPPAPDHRPAPTPLRRPTAPDTRIGHASGHPPGCRPAPDSR